ncbi:hypothetical protein J3R30DRAFT_3403702 [Lentinula aciculospora]|uniref:C2H2-type domain-containing protein n=1 Tax=Lentinula aciculospora TaxID=153920 RepID=A0A9W9DQI8_9AGAR|nr:hypothetical protein J3R30DRAFT_3403702 [Lentinula aciculospora]
MFVDAPASSASTPVASETSAERIVVPSLDSRTIEEIMEELYAVAYGPGSSSSNAQVTEGFENSTLWSLNQQPPSWSSNQRMVGNPKVVFVVQMVHGREVLRPMIPIRKTEYFDMEAFEKVQNKNLVHDAWFSEILWSKSYDVELSFKSNSESGITHQDNGLNQYFNLETFVQAQRQKPSEPPGQTAERLAFLNSMQTLNRCTRTSSDNRWQEIVKNYSALPSAIFPDNVSPQAVTQELKGFHVCFLDPKGERHYTNIVLSDQYMLVPLSSQSVADHFVWDSYGTQVPNRFRHLFSKPCFVDPRETCPPSSPAIDSNPSAAKVSASNKRRVNRTRNPSKKLCTLKKHTAAVKSLPRFIGPATRGNPQSECSSASSASFDLDFSSPFKNSSSSSSSSTISLNLNCWNEYCTRIFTSLEHLEAHHNLCHQGQIKYICPFRDSCSHITARQAEMKRHVKSVQHLGGASLMCPNACGVKTFSRADALRRHLKGCLNRK